MTTVELPGFNRDDVISGHFPEISVHSGTYEGYVPLKAAEKQFRGYCKTIQDGVACRLLRTTGGGWRTGKLKLHIKATLGLVPDKPDQEQAPGALMKN